MKGRAAVCALFALALTAGLAAAEAPPPPLVVIEGIWGFDLAPDMSCAVNPVWIKVKPGGQTLEFSWPKSVDYADGTASDAVTFTVTDSTATHLTLRRDRDGTPATIAFAPDGRSFHYIEADPDAGSRFDRCAALGS